MKKVRKYVGDIIRTYKTGKRIIGDKYFIETNQLNKKELKKEVDRTEIINYLLTLTPSINYLEIGVRNPEHNFNKIRCTNKFSVDPGLENNSDKINYVLTSDEFFNGVDNGSLGIDTNIKFDLVFIDGLHLAEQVERDIRNSLRFIDENGFVVIHDCNPLTEFHQRENYYFRNSPARGFWNGTTWKAFYKYRHVKDLYSICFDTDFGVGVLAKKKWTLFNNLKTHENIYFEYHNLCQKRTEHLNLLEFNCWKSKLEDLAQYKNKI